MREYNAKLKIELFIFRLIYKPLLKRSAKQILQGRLLNPNKPKDGRWLWPEVKQLLKSTWGRVDTLLTEAALVDIPTLGNRHNVFLAVLTTAVYQTLLETGLGKHRSASLVADVGWKLYGLGICLMSLPFRLTMRDPGKRVNKTIRALLVFPFNAPGKPGYEVKVQEQDGKVLTHWTWCPPQAFVRSLTEKEGDKGELEAFYKSWCLYDWPGADLMAGDGKRGHYERKLTLSKGDPVCDMCWLHEAQ
jgi:hypothetical protein